MTGNLTDGWSSVPIYCLYVTQGSIISGSNLLVVLSILRHEALRTNKEYVLMLALSLSDSCNMTGFLTAGLYRLYLVFTNQHANFLPPFECAIKPHNMMLIFGVPWSNIMLLVVSVDRYICVSNPLKYIGYTRSYYSTRLLSPPFMFALVYATGYILMAYIWGSDDPTLPAACVTYTVLQVAPASVSLFYQSVPSSFAFLSIIVYLAVWYKHKKHSQVMDVGHLGANAEELKRQHRVTATLALSCLFTCVLFCIPMVVANVILALGYKGFSLYFYLLSTLNPLCNVFLYQIRHKEMRIALRKLFSCQSMPLDLRLWTNNQTTQHA